MADADDKTSKQHVTAQHILELRNLGVNVASNENAIKLVQRRVGVLEARAEETDIALDSLSEINRMNRKELAELKQLLGQLKGESK